MAGINRASLSSIDFALAKNPQTRHKCVFISHKKEDEQIAIAVGDYLMNEAGLDIYLDINDCELREAVSVDNDKKIVSSIKRGLDCSEALLCIVTDKTRLSWWVPYEIGLADKEEKTIASVKVKDINDFPEFLKIHQMITNTTEFLSFVADLQHYGRCFHDENIVEFSKKDNSVLEQYFG